MGYYKNSVNGYTFKFKIGQSVLFEHERFFVRQIELRTDEHGLNPNKWVLIGCEGKSQWVKEERLAAINEDYEIV